jgi:hypothetical protein
MNSHNLRNQETTSFLSRTVELAGNIQVADAPALAKPSAGVPAVCFCTRVTDIELLDLRRWRCDSGA